MLEYSLKNMDLPGVSGVSPSHNKCRYFEDEDNDNESYYLIDSESNSDSEDSWRKSIV